MLKRKAHLSMMMPDRVLEAIEREAAQIPAPILIKAAAELGRGYRDVSPCAPPLAGSAAARIAYVAARMPAIFQVNQLLCAALARLCPAIDIRSVLDLGCGPGSATIAASQVFGPLEATLVDRDPEWSQAAQRLIAAAEPGRGAPPRFLARDLEDARGLKEHDLVMISYALGELAPSSRTAVVESAWALSHRAMLIAEPGTPRGFDAIIAAREALIAAGANIVAPCTQAGRCPLAGRDWCHFDTKVERTRSHRQIKGGTLPYEIEKYSYLIAARQTPAIPPGAARVIRHPLKKSGHVILDLCTFEGSAQRLVISRSDGEPYRRARGAKWGEIWVRD